MPGGDAAHTPRPLQHCVVPSAVSCCYERGQRGVLCSGAMKGRFVLKGAAKGCVLCVCAEGDGGGAAW